MHFTLRSNPFSSDLTIVKADSLFGKLMALLWHNGSHAVQPLTHLCGLATIAFPSWKAKTPCGQNSTHRGLPIFAHPSHFSGKIVGYQTPHDVAIIFRLYGFFYSQSNIQFQSLLGRFCHNPYI
jgi:hypothetical protein